MLYQFSLFSPISSTLASIVCFFHCICIRDKGTYHFKSPQSFKLSWNFFEYIINVLDSLFFLFISHLVPFIPQPTESNPYCREVAYHNQRQKSPKKCIAEWTNSSLYYYFWTLFYMALLTTQFFLTASYSKFPYALEFFIDSLFLAFLKSLFKLQLFLTCQLSLAESCPLSFGCHIFFSWRAHTLLWFKLPHQVLQNYTFPLQIVS